jgi:serine/threonine protein kinase
LTFFFGKFVPQACFFDEAGRMQLGDPNDHYDPRRADIWSCGVVLYMLATGKAWFDHEGIRLSNFVRFPREQRGFALFDFPRGLPQIAPALRDLILKMLEVDPRERVTMKDVLEHPFVTGEQRKNPKYFLFSFL